MEQELVLYVVANIIVIGVILGITVPRYLKNKSSRDDHNATTQKVNKTVKLK